MKEVKDLDNYWNDLVFSASGGNASEMAALRKFNIIDFFDYVDNKMKKDG